MGAIPNRLVGFQDWTRDAGVRGTVRARLGRAAEAGVREESDRDVRRDGARGARRRSTSSARTPRSRTRINDRTERLLRGLDHLVVQDIFLTRTAEFAHVVLPAAATWCEAEGTVTNSERRVQRVRKALEPPGEARDDMWIICEIARAARPRPGATRRPRTYGTRCARLAPIFTRHDLRAAREARRPALALLRRAASGRAVPARPAVGGPGRGPAGTVLASWSTTRRSNAPTPSIRSS